MTRTNLWPFLALLAMPCLAQELKLSSESGVIAETAGGIKFFTGTVFIPGDEELDTTPAELIVVETPSSRVTVRVFTDELPVTLSPAGQRDNIRYYIWTLPGTWLVDVVDFDIGDIQSLKVTVGEDEPDEPDEPDHPIPPDEFDNIGQRVHDWTLNASLNTEHGEIHADVAETYRTSLMRWNDAQQEINERIGALPGYDHAEYQEFTTGYDSDLASRWDELHNNRAKLADYWTAVAKGFGVQ